MRRRRRVGAGAALLVLGATLTHEVLTPTPFHHTRSAGLLVLAAAIALALLALAPRVPSLGVAVGAGIAAGGALATLVSGIAWSGVPDPLVRGGVAFNLADLAIALGDMILVAAILAHGWTHRGDLRRAA